VGESPVDGVNSPAVGAPPPPGARVPRKHLAAAMEITRVWISEYHTFSPLFQNCFNLALALLFLVWAIPVLTAAVRRLLNRRPLHGASGAVATRDSKFSINDDGLESQPLLKSPPAASVKFCDRTIQSRRATELEAELSKELYKKQRSTFWLAVVAHAAVVVGSGLQAHGEARAESQPAWWHLAAWSVVQPILWAAALALRAIDRTNGECARSTSQAFYFLLFAGAAVRLYDDLEDTVVPSQTLVPRSVAFYITFTGISASFILALVDIVVARSSPHFLPAAEARLSAGFAELSVNFVNSGAYSTQSGTERKRWHEMTPLEQHEASKTFADKKLGAGLSLKMLFRMIMRVDGLLMLIGVCGAVTGALGSVILPMAIGRATDIAARAQYCHAFGLVNKTSMTNDHECSNISSQIHEVGLTFVLPLLMIGMGQFLNGSFVEVSGTRLICRIQRMVFTGIVRQDSSYFDSQKVGEITSLLSTNVAMMRSGMTNALANSIKGIFQFVLGLVIMLHGVDGRGSPKLFGIVVGLGAPAVVSICVLMKVGTVFSKIMTEKSQKSNGVATEMLSAIKTLLSFNLESYAEDKYGAAVTNTMQTGMKKDILQGSAMGITYVSWMSAVSLTWYFGAYMINDGEIDMKYLATFTSLISQVLGGMMAMFGVLPALGSAVGAAANLFKPLLIQPAIKSGHGKEITRPRGELRLSGIKFAYPTKPGLEIFSALDLEIPQGKSIAIVGNSGSGKSTILQLIERYYDPLAGSVTIDDIDLRDIDIEYLRSTVGMVMQEPKLLSGTIEDNIRHGKRNATLQEVVEAAKLANAHDFIEAQPEGYQTKVGEGGASLSGGQKQRIAIARAVVKDPTILLLDEATSALDSTSQEEVQKALDRVSRGRTTLTVAHRQSAIKNADMIFVLDGGVVVEAGTHHELLALDGHYTRLYGTSPNGQE